MTEIAEKQRSGFSNEEELGGWRRNTEQERCAERRKRKEWEGLALWEESSLCGAVSNMLSKGWVNTYLSTHSTFLAVLWTPLYQLAAENPPAVRTHSAGGVCSCQASNGKSGWKRQFARGKRARCSHSPPRHWMEVLIHLSDFLQQIITGFALPLFLKHFFWNATFVS